MNIILIFMLSLGFTSAKYVEKYLLEDAHNYFEEFLRTYNKEYDEAEKAVRYKIFVESLKQINEYNEKSNHTQFVITKFADLTSEEFRARYTGYRDGDLNGYCTSSQDVLGLKPVNAPEEFSWLSQGKVGPVKDQKDCGSCWAFSTTGNVESAYAIKTGQLLSLSEQQLVDCDKLSSGCTSGLPGFAIQYLEQKGAMSEDSYPYEEREGQCRYNEQNVQVRVKGCVTVQATEDELVEKLVQIGPLSVAVDSTNLNKYGGGIMIGELCEGQQVNHAVLLVGYGKGPDGTPYWLIKNSWGENWGENGYFKIQRGVNCVRIADRPPLTAVIA